MEALVERLAQAGVSVLVDVRLNPISRRPGFSRKALQATLAEAGIDYRHERELGNPRDNRDAFRRGDGTEGRRRMRAILEDSAAPALARLVELARTTRVAVMCVERDRSHCHRDVIIAMAQELEPSIEVAEDL